MIYQVAITVCGVAMWGWFLRRGRSALPRREYGPVPWGGLHVLLLALFFLAALRGSQALMARLAGQGGDEYPLLPVSFQVATAALANGLTMLLAMLVAGRYGRQGLPALGLRLGPGLEQVVFGFLGFLAILPVMVALNFVLVHLAPLLRYEIRVQDVVEVFKSGPRTPAYTLMVLYAVVGAPVAEEIIFRGFLQGYLRRLFPAGRAILVSALAFAFFHQPAHAAVAVFFLGLILGYQRERTRSLLAPILTHVFFNLHTFITTQVMRM